MTLIFKMSLNLLGRNSLEIHIPSPLSKDILKAYTDHLLFKCRRHERICKTVENIYHTSHPNQKKIFKFYPARLLQ